MSKNSIITGSVSRSSLYLRHELPRLEASTQRFLKSIQNEAENIERYKDNGITIQSGGKAEHFTFEEAQEHAPEQMAEMLKLQKVYMSALVAVGFIKAAEPETIAKEKATAITEDKPEGKPAGKPDSKSDGKSDGKSNSKPESKQVKAK